MESKDVSLNLVLRKRGVQHGSQTVSAVSDFASAEKAFSSLRPHTPDTSDEVPSPQPLALPEEAQDFLERRIPGAALEVFPWQGILVKSAVLEMSVWVVRIRQDGVELAKETGHPALLLDDVLSQKGKTREEAREALLPVLIAPVQ